MQGVGSNFRFPPNRCVRCAGVGVGVNASVALLAKTARFVLRISTEIEENNTDIHSSLSSFPAHICPMSTSVLLSFALFYKSTVGFHPPFFCFHAFFFWCTHAVDALHKHMLSMFWWHWLNSAVCSIQTGGRINARTFASTRAARKERLYIFFLPDGFFSTSVDAAVEEWNKDNGHRKNKKFPRQPKKQQGRLSL